LHNEKWSNAIECLLLSQERRLHSVLRDAHNGRVCSLHFFPGKATPPHRTPHHTTPLTTHNARLRCEGRNAKDTATPQYVALPTDTFSTKLQKGINFVLNLYFFILKQMGIGFHCLPIIVVLHPLALRAVVRLQASHC
jgi:hypothetical protein